MKYLPYIFLGIIILSIVYIAANFQITILAKSDSTDFIVNSKGGLRDSCIKCVRKHIAQARVLLDESKLGYPNHFFLALGHLAEAEAESIKDFPELATKIREMREGLYAGQEVDLMVLFDDVNVIEKAAIAKA